MCCSISAKAKAQPAAGFPPAFKFMFDKPKKMHGRAIPHSEALAGLKFFSPNGRIFFFDSVSYCRNITQDMLDSFLSYIGVVYHDNRQHSLVGKGYRHEWTDVNGVNKVVFGKVASSSTDWNNGFKHNTFTVELNDESCNIVEEFSSYNAKILRTQEISSTAAYGGCLSYERDLLKRRHAAGVLMTIERNMPLKCWCTPDMRKEELVVASDGSTRPKLTLVFRGWKLQFSVKKSTIRTAGLGCFLRCTRIFADLDESNTCDFDLRPGELLDLGVYGPFREEDKKASCIFNLKNYVHSFAPEEWCFGSPDDKHQVCT